MFVFQNNLEGPECTKPGTTSMPKSTKNNPGELLLLLDEFGAWDGLIDPSLRWSVDDPWFVPRVRLSNNYRGYEYTEFGAPTTPKISKSHHSSFILFSEMLGTCNGLIARSLIGNVRIAIVSGRVSLSIYIESLEYTKLGTLGNLSPSKTNHSSSPLLP